MYILQTINSNYSYYQSIVRKLLSAFTTNETYMKEHKSLSPYDDKFN